MSVRLSSFALSLGLALSLSFTATAQTPTPAAPVVTATPKPKAGKATPTPMMTATPAPVATPDFSTPVPTPEEPEPTPEPMPTPEPIPEEGVNSGKPTGALVHGFVITRYDNTDGKGPRKSAHAFIVQNARIRLEGKSADTVTYLAAIEPLLATGPLQEAFVGWNPRRAIGPMRDLRVRAGQMRRPIGLEGRLPEEALQTMDHSWATRFLQNGGNYDLGLTLGTTISIFEVDVGMFNGSGPANPLFGSPIGGADPLDDKVIVGRAGLALMNDQVKTGFSFLSGETQDPLYVLGSPSPGLPQTTSAQVWRAGFDLMGEVAGVVLQSEAIYGNTTLVDTAPAIPDGPTGTGGSAYIFVGYRLPHGFLPNMRFEYAELTMGDDKDTFFRPKDWNNAVAVGLNWAPVKHVLVRSQYEFVTGFTSTPSAFTYYNPASGALYSDEMSGTFSASIQADF